MTTFSIVSRIVFKGGLFDLPFSYLTGELAPPISVFVEKYSSESGRALREPHFRFEHLNRLGQRLHRP